jgi:broad specificity phosphatase PhoE
MCLDAPSPAVPRSAPSFAVVRHTERSDSDFETIDPMFPFDPTLSRRGKINASKIAGELANKMDAKDSLTVICSPYMRCVQTGIEICKVFGCGMLIDQAWGEVMAPDLFGGDTANPFGAEAAPPNATRNLAALVALARKSAVEVFNEGDFAGDKPLYPETVGTARSRYGEAFLSSLERSRKSGNSVIIVTHGEALPVCLSFFQDAPTLAGNVPYGAYLIGSIVPPVNGLPCASFLNDRAADTPTSSVSSCDFIQLEKHTLPVYVAPALSSPTDESVKYIVKCIVESSSAVSSPAPLQHPASEEVPVKEILSPKDVTSKAAPGFCAPPEILQRLAGKRASPTAGSGGGLAARRRLRHAMDLGSDFHLGGSEFSDHLIAPSALVTAAA